MSEWIPVRYHKITDSERAENRYPAEWTAIFDCLMPDDGQEVLITTKSGYVMKDTAYCDVECFLDCYGDWLDVLAWMPSPEPYRYRWEEAAD